MVPLESALISGALKHTRSHKLCVISLSNLVLQNTLRPKFVLCEAKMLFASNLRNDLQPLITLEEFRLAKILY